MAEWTDDLATGIEEVDNQHKEIFRRVNTLLAACKEGKGKEKVGEVIGFLGEYVIDHFKAEEALQVKSMYPGYTDHKKLHQEFIGSFAKLKADFDANGPTLTTVMSTNKVVVDWLIKHIKKEDRALADHMAGRGATSGRPH